MTGGGHEVPMDRPTAQRWFRQAAERGHAYAQMMLGRYLARGLAGERDFERARTWLERALAQGLQEARNDIAGLPPPPGTETTEPQVATS
jgi:TPR repeat protein